MTNIGKGSKQKFTLGVGPNSLGNHKLSEVAFSVDFYAKEKKDSQVNAYYTVKSTDANVGKDDETGEVYLVCDTSTLDLGRIYATLIVEYADKGTSEGGTGAMLKEIIPLMTEINIVPSEVAPYKMAVDFMFYEDTDVKGNVYMYNYGATGLVMNPDPQLGIDFNYIELVHGGSSGCVGTAVGGDGWQKKGGSNFFSIGDICYCNSTGKCYELTVSQSTGYMSWREVE